MADESVRSLLHRPAVEVALRDTLRSVARTLTEESVGVAVVVAHHELGRGAHAVGVISERDVVAALADGADPDEIWAEDVMTEDLASAAPDDPVLAAARCMLDNEIRHLPVVEGDAIVGVISIRDALQAALDAALAVAADG
jgi:CBS domain-containing protein